MRSFRWLILVVLCLQLVPAAWSQQRIDVPSRAGVTEPVYVYAAANPVASVVLFPGARGLVGSIYKNNNFLIRVAGQFAAAGITAAVADTPSDHAYGMDPTFRASEAQAADAAAIVAFLHGRAAVPVWLIGTSIGTVSAANAAVRLGPPRIAGVVLTSSVWTGGMGIVPISTLRVPVLIVHNRDDGCRSSPFAEAAPAFATLTAAPARQLIAVAGGSLRGSPCEALSPHGYYGIEDQVVPPIIAWIKAH
jgi:hypothetical protein